MPSEEKRKEAFLENKEKMRKRHKRVEDFEDNSDMNIKSESSTISLESLQEQLQTLKHEINIETIQVKLRAHEQFFKELGEDKELLFDIIRLYKQKKEAKQKKKI